MKELNSTTASHIIVCLYTIYVVIVMIIFLFNLSASWLRLLDVCNIVFTLIMGYDDVLWCIKKLIGKDGD